MRPALAAVFAAASLFASASAHAQQRPAITGIAFLRVYDTQPEATATFYGTTLALASGPSLARPDGTLLYVASPLQWIEVIPHAGPEPDARLAAVGFTTRDAAALERYLRAKGVAIEQPLHEGEFSVRDPEGHLVVFVDSHATQGVAKLAATAKPNASAPSHRIIHVGFVVRDAAKEDTFWRDILGFTPYWHGGRSETVVDWISQQVPDGTDWLEYMLNLPAQASLKQAGSANHFSLGTERVQGVLAQLQANGCTDTQCRAIQVGRDGKIQLNLFDPDQTRVEFMEYVPAIKSCCSPIVGRAVGPVEAK